MREHAEIARLRAQADDFDGLAETLDKLRRERQTSDTELMRRLIEDCRSWSSTLRGASSYLECVALWYRRGKGRGGSMKCAFVPYAISKF